MKIAVTNAVLSNTGDAAIFESIVDSLCREFGPGVEIVVFDSHAKVTRRLYPEWTIRQQLAVSPPRRPGRLRAALQRVRHAVVGVVAIEGLFRRWVLSAAGRRTEFGRALRALNDADLVVSSGGTYLVDHYNFRARVVELELAKSLGKPVTLWTQSLGPFASDRALQQIRSIAQVTDAAFFRDERSAASWADAVGSVPPGEVVPDSVFALTPPPRRSRTPRRALISVREWSRGVDAGTFAASAYESGMRAAAELLLAEGFQTVALSTCQGVPSYAYDDSAVARRIFAGTSIAIDSSFHTPSALLDELADADVVVTTRMHLAILALISRVPVIAVAYEFKTLELFHSLGLGDFVCRIEDADAEWMADRVGRLLEDPELARLTPEQLDALRGHARKPAALVGRLAPGI